MKGREEKFNSIDITNDLSRVFEKNAISYDLVE